MNATLLIQNCTSPIITYPPPKNHPNYYNSEISEIMQIISNTRNENVLYENYNRLFDIYLEDVPYIGLYRDTDLIVYHQSLVGNIKANAFNVYHNIDKWYRQ